MANKSLQSLSHKQRSLSHGNTSHGTTPSLVASHNSGRIGGKAKALVLVTVMSKGDDRAIVQLSNDFSKAAEQLLFETEKFTFHRKRFHREYQRSY